MNRFGALAVELPGIQHPLAEHGHTIEVALNEVAGILPHRALSHGRHWRDRSVPCIQLIRTGHHHNPARSQNTRLIFGKHGFMLCVVFDRLKLTTRSTTHSPEGIFAHSPTRVLEIGSLVDSSGMGNRIRRNVHSVNAVGSAGEHGRAVPFATGDIADFSGSAILRQA